MTKVMLVALMSVALLVQPVHARVENGWSIDMEMQPITREQRDVSKGEYTCMYMRTQFILGREPEEKVMRFLEIVCGEWLILQFARPEEK